MSEFSEKFPGGGAVGHFRILMPSVLVTAKIPAQAKLGRGSQGNDLLPFAADVIVPIDEGAVRIVAPSPHVQFEERWYAVAVRCADQVK